MNSSYFSYNSPFPRICRTINFSIDKRMDCVKVKRKGTFQLLLSLCLLRRITMQWYSATHSWVVVLLNEVSRSWWIEKTTFDYDILSFNYCSITISLINRSKLNYRRCNHLATTFVVFVSVSPSCVTVLRARKNNIRIESNYHHQISCRLV